MDNRIVIAKFNNGERFAFTDFLFQYDYGQELKIEGLELPSVFEVHFASELHGESTTSLYTDGSVTIPDSYLTKSGKVYAWIYLHDTNSDGETEYSIIIDVKSRAKPTHETPTPVQQSEIEQMIAALETAVSESETNVSHYPKIVEDYWYVWDAETEDWVNTEVRAKGEKGDPGEYTDLINDSTTSSTLTWSSNKLNTQISGKMNSNNPTGTGGIAVGDSCVASGTSSAFGAYAQAQAYASHAEGFMNTASAFASHAEGSNCIASGTESHAEGSGTKASGINSHTEGSNTNATGIDAHAEGSGTTASGTDSHAEGMSTKASGYYSHAEGTSSKASNNNAHAEGEYTEASGRNSHAQGYYTIAKGENQSVLGKANIADDINKYAEIVGNGYQNNRSNARTLDWQGNEWLAGALTTEGGIGTQGDVTIAGSLEVQGTIIKGSRKVPAFRTLKLDVGANTSTTSVGNFLQEDEPKTVWDIYARSGAGGFSKYDRAMQVIRSVDVVDDELRITFNSHDYAFELLLIEYKWKD